MTSAMRSGMFKQGYEYALDEDACFKQGMMGCPGIEHEPYDDPEWIDGYEYFWEKANER